MGWQDFQTIQQIKKNKKAITNGFFAFLGPKALLGTTPGWGVIEALASPSLQLFYFQLCPQVVDWPRLQLCPCPSYPKHPLHL